MWNKYPKIYLYFQNYFLLIFKKNKVWQVFIKFTKTVEFDLRAFENMTWRDLIQGTLEYLGEEVINYFQDFTDIPS